MTVGYTERMTRKGFSLLELTIGLAILAVVASVGMLAMKKSTSNAGSKGLAEVFSDELRAARQQAIAKGAPVAYCFAGTSTRTTYRASGTLRALCSTPPHQFGSEFGGAFLYLGQWALGSGASFAVTPPPTGSTVDRFNLTTWLAGLGSDPALVFFPNGRVRARGLELLEGRYCVLVTQGIDPPAGLVTSAFSPYTVAVSPMGDVEVIKGAWQGADNLAQAGSGQPPASLGTANWAPPVNGAPNITSVILYPKTNTAIHGTDGQHATSDSEMELYPEEAPNGERNFAPLTLLVYATDPDNDPLTFQWRVEPVNVENDRQGALSYPKSGRMVPQPGGDQLGVCSWQPPPQGKFGGIERWRLLVTVEDGRGGVADTGTSTYASMVKKVVLDSPGKVAFDKYAFDSVDYDFQEAVFTMNVDGMAVARITNLPKVNENQPDLSPAGDWVAFSSSAEGNFVNSDIWIATTDGHSRINLTNTTGRTETNPKWSPDGSLICFYSAAILSDGTAGAAKVYVIEPHRPGGGSNPGKQIAHNSLGTTWNTSPPTWNPTSKFVAFLDDDYTYANDYSNLIISAVDGSTVGDDYTRWYKRVDGSFYDVYTASWSPKGDHIAISGVRDPAAYDYNSEQTFIVTVDKNNPIPTSIPTGSESLSPNPVRIHPDAWSTRSENGMAPFAWSPGGNQLAVCIDKRDGDHRVFRYWRGSGPTSPPDYSATPTQLTGNSFSCVQPAYTSGGGYLILEAWRADNFSPIELFRVRANYPDDKYPQLLNKLNSVSEDVSTHSVSR